MIQFLSNDSKMNGMQYTYKQKVVKALHVQTVVCCVLCTGCHGYVIAKQKCVAAIKSITHLPKPVC